MPEQPQASASASASASAALQSAEPAARSRGGFRPELRTIPEGITNVRATKSAHLSTIRVMSNFVRIHGMDQRQLYQYRVDFEPNLESVSLRCRLFRNSTKDLFTSKVTFDGMSDARSSTKIANDQATLLVENPQEPSEKVSIKIKRVGEVAWGSFEMIRVYNMHMKQFLKALGFFAVSKTGAYVHQELANDVGQNSGLVTVRGFRTAANVHEKGVILMNLESVHKLMQRQNVLVHMKEIRGLGGNIQNNARVALTGKLVVTKYNKSVYKIEDVDFTVNPRSTFFDRRANKDISYLEYYTQRYNLTINDPGQPLLLVVPNSPGRNRPDDGEEHKIYLIPELCNIAGLTDQQRNDNRLKMDLIRSSQISPTDRVAHMITFIDKLHNCREVENDLRAWGYSYDHQPLLMENVRVIDRTRVGSARRAHDQDPKLWDPANAEGNFDQVLKEKIVKRPQFDKLAIIIGRSELNKKQTITQKLQLGMDKIGNLPAAAKVFEINDGDTPNHFTRELRSLPADVSAAVVVLSGQNKDRYDAIKKLATVERGLITQVVTSRLLCDERKSGGASIKIGIQMAAKLGGEPWYVHIPLGGAMICGYDTYHDTANRGRSFGAFVASTNRTFSRWYSKADSHERLDELSSHMAENLTASLNKWKELNGRYPDRLFIYRDGVGDGQIEHVFNVELKNIQSAAKAVDDNIRLTFIIVNKRVGARFYMKHGAGYSNPPPGTVVDDIVTRQERYDFYLISQSTRHGTVAPTYYNILHDESGLDPSKQQELAYKLCSLYYNWSGTVRVPAPCQYAHKLALLCGEHLHAVPNATLDDRLHFL